MLRIGLISDIHANVYGLEAALSAIQKANVNLIICAGDIVGYYPFINETIDLLRAEKILCIMGNHDAILVGRLSVEDARWRQYMLDYTAKVIRLDNLEWIDQLPLTLSLDLQGLGGKVYHGSPWSPLTEYIYPDHNDFGRFGYLKTDFVVLGHTHWPLLQKVNEITIINPGSCGQPRDYKPGACYALLETVGRTVSFHRVTYKVQKVTHVLQTLRFDQKLIDILCRTK